MSDDEMVDATEESHDLDEWAAACVAEVCIQLGEMSGMTPEEVYDAQFDGRSFTVSQRGDEIRIEFHGDEEGDDDGQVR